jgi:hypothetical protein
MRNLEPKSFRSVEYSCWKVDKLSARFFAHAGSLRIVHQRQETEHIVSHHRKKKKGSICHKILTGKVVETIATLHFFVHVFARGSLLMEDHHLMGDHAFESWDRTSQSDEARRLEGPQDNDDLPAQGRD